MTGASETTDGVYVEGAATNKGRIPGVAIAARNCRCGASPSPGI